MIDPTSDTWAFIDKWAHNLMLAQMRRLRESLVPEREADELRGSIGALEALRQLAIPQAPLSAPVKPIDRSGY